MPSAPFISGAMIAAKSRAVTYPAVQFSGTTSLTYVWTDEGWLYLAVVLERVHGTRYATRETAIADLFDYIEVFYNRSRQHSSLGYVSPTRFLAGWISSQHKQAVAA